jgi:hypothetical protein
MGFRDVRQFAHGESYSLGDGLSVTAVPFFGEGRNRLGFGGNCYLISRLGRNVLVHADASPDSEGRSLVSTGELQELVNRWGSIQVVFGTWWQERRFVGSLSPLAIFSPGIRPQDWLDDTEWCDCSPEFLCDLLRVAGATQMLLYAEGGKACFLPRNRVYTSTISFLWKPLAQMQETVQRATGAKVTEAQPYLTVCVPQWDEPYLDWSAVAARWPTSS